MKPKNRSAAPPFHRWRGLPKELPQSLYHVSHYARATAQDLYRIADEYDGKIETRGERWDVSLCCSMQVPGPDRRNACRALGQLKESGAIRVFDGFVVVCLGQSLDGLPAHTKADSLGLQSDSLGFTPDSTRIPLRSDIESSNCNHSNPKPQNRTEQNREQSESETRARESSARFEKPPVGIAPPELETASLPTARVWLLYTQEINREGMLGTGSQFYGVLLAVSDAITVEVGASEGVEFDRAVQRLLRAWLSDKFVKERNPSLANLGKNLHRYTRAKAKPPVKLVGEPSKASDVYLDEELLAWPAWREGELSIWQKQRRWELQARAEQCAGGAS